MKFELLAHSHHPRATSVFFKHPLGGSFDSFMSLHCTLEAQGNFKVSYSQDIARKLVRVGVNNLLQSYRWREEERMVLHRLCSLRRSVSIKVIYNQLGIILALACQELFQLQLAKQVRVLDMPSFFASSLQESVAFQRLHAPGQKGKQWVHGTREERVWLLVRLVYG